MRFHVAPNKKNKNSKYKFSIKRAFKEMHRSRLNDKRPFGEILGDSVLNSIKTLVMVGGFIILFSVIIKLLYLTGITTAIAAILKYIFLLFSIPVEYAVPFISGFFEITTGIQMISQVQPDTLLITVMLDRKSTRLNSSHVAISYAVFCLKKKK